MTVQILNELFSSNVRSKILNLFFMNPKDRFYLRQVQSLINSSISPVQIELDKLTKLNILLSHKDGNRRYFKVNESHYLYPDLKNIIIKTSGVAETIRNFLNKDKYKIYFAFIYGSYARGKELISSDIDICIIGDISLKVIYEDIARQKDFFNREINVTIYPVSEFKLKYYKNHHFITELVNTAKIFIVGNEDEFTRFITTK